MPIRKILENKEAKRTGAELIDKKLPFSYQPPSFGGLEQHQFEVSDVDVSKLDEIIKEVYA